MPTTIDYALMECPAQAGGIRTGTLDAPQPLGGQNTRVAFIDTGAGLRYTVALDRGGDIYDATYMDCPLAYLTQNGLKPAERADGVDMAWLASWAGGLVTTCGPLHVGRPVEGGEPWQAGVHGRHHLTPAAILAVDNADPRTGKRDFTLKLRIDQTSMFGPCVETKRSISGTLGQPAIHIHDTLTNRGDTPIPEALLYHCNLGHPLLTEGTQLDIEGDIQSRWGTLLHDQDPNAFKHITAPRDDHAGAGEGGVVIQPESDAQGLAQASVINPHRKLKLTFAYHTQQLPGLTVWQHVGPAGYVCGIEPFVGPTPGPDSDGSNPRPRIQPGESRDYQLNITLT
ncbi:DUF4432 family protein [Mucisphaera calidilacus]|uniref:Aldose 1-epimerase n=1 Tax=Mucisphaera calidilacus TaxID=2527982 RepID=A0A518BWR8_9BACT|nr:DUF4432 family protein [Mucisphaera calidilacus]QDU71415.1 hypothetical protein Pan265_12650 [Mucisphaera calidilacus]